MLFDHKKISLLAVDEAHYLSEWGHDFRPDYLYIAEARRQLGNPLTVALTATATTKVQSDIVYLLCLPEATTRIVTGFNRPNLTLEVKYTNGDEAKFRVLSELLRGADPCTDLPGAIIIYTGTRRDAEEVAEFVCVVCKLQAEHYHAGLPAEDRAHIQERFIDGVTPVIVATNAFGMGIDRADVRQVIHYSLPGSLEAYYQMIEQLVEMEYLKIVGGMYPVVALTPKGEVALEQRFSVPLKISKSLGNAEVMRARAQFEAGGTVGCTARLFADGLRPEQIAKERGLTLQTIYDHLAQSISVGKISVQQVVPDEVRHETEKAIDTVGNTRFLSPIKALLPESIGFNMIRCVVAAYAKPSEVSKTPETCGSKSVIRRIVEIGASGSSAALPELFAALKSEDGNARRLAASALGKIKDAQAVQPLLDLLAKETKPQVRQYAVRALGNIGDLRAKTMLARIADDENEMDYTRNSATRAIMQIHAKSQHTPSSPETRYPAQNPESVTRTLQSAPSALPPDPVSSFLLSSHPRPLKGNWRTGFALDFHSSYKGADWNRSSIGGLVYRLKYESDASVLPVLIEHTQRLFAAQPEMSRFEIIVPVPSSVQREFSPVHEFCRALAKSLGKRVQIVLSKTRQTKPQKEMHTLPQKRDNVTGAFRVNSDITGRSILLGDDLFNSGATLEEITRLLLKHGASCINVLTLTRTIHSDA